MQYLLYTFLTFHSDIDKYIEHWHSNRVDPDIFIIWLSDPNPKNQSDPPEFEPI